MILLLEDVEVIELIENNTALRNKVEEALDLLRSANPALVVM
jgi:hypothetical protein